MRHRFSVAAHGRSGYVRHGVGGARRSRPGPPPRSASRRGRLGVDDARRSHVPVTTSGAWEPDTPQRGGGRSGRHRRPWTAPRSSPPAAPATAGRRGPWGDRRSAGRRTTQGLHDRGITSIDRDGRGRWSIGGRHYRAAQASESRAVDVEQKGGLGGLFAHAEPQTLRSGGAEAVAHARLGDQVAGPGRVGLELPPQVGEVDAQRVAGVAVVRAPHLLAPSGRPR